MEPELHQKETGVLDTKESKKQTEEKELGWRLKISRSPKLVY